MPPVKLIKSKFLMIILSLGWHGLSRTQIYHEKFHLELCRSVKSDKKCWHGPEILKEMWHGPKHIGMGEKRLAWANKVKLGYQKKKSIKIAHATSETNQIQAIQVSYDNFKFRLACTKQNLDLP